MKTDDLEKSLRSIVAEISLYPVSRITANADLSDDLGIDSLRIVVLFNEIRQRLKRAVPFTRLERVEYSTFAKLLSLVRDAPRPV